MKLELNHQALMHSSLIANLEAVAKNCTTLDATEHAIAQLGLSRDWWKVTRGGSHIAVNYIAGSESIRCAMFTEEKSKEQIVAEFNTLFDASLAEVAAHLDRNPGTLVVCFENDGLPFRQQGRAIAMTGGGIMVAFPGSRTASILDELNGKAEKVDAHGGKIVAMPVAAWAAKRTAEVERLKVTMAEMAKGQR